MRKVLSLLVIAILAITALSAQGAKDDGVDNSLNDVLERGTFILGLDDSFPFLSA